MLFERRSGATPRGRWRHAHTPAARAAGKRARQVSAGDGERPTHVATACVKSGRQAGRLGAAQDGTRASGGRRGSGSGPSFSSFLHATDEAFHFHAFRRDARLGRAVSRQRNGGCGRGEGASKTHLSSGAEAPMRSCLEAWALWLDEEGRKGRRGRAKRPLRTAARARRIG